MNDTIKAGKLLDIDKMSKLKHAALRLAMLETQCMPDYIDWKKIHRITKRFRIGKQFQFYNERKDLWHA